MNFLLEVPAGRFEHYQRKRMSTQVQYLCVFACCAVNSAATPTICGRAELLDSVHLDFLRISNTQPMHSVPFSFVQSAREECTCDQMTTPQRSLVINVRGLSLSVLRRLPHQYEKREHIIYRVFAANLCNPSLLKPFINENMDTFMRFNNH
jgi:hypothetical protein